MATLVAIVSVVSSASVAIAVAVLSNRSATTRLELQISAERLDELRGVLDDAAAALRASLFAMNGISSLLDQALERALGEGPTVDDLYAEFQTRFWEVRRFQERIALRLGPHAPLTRTYAAAGDACQDFFDVWAERWNGAAWDGTLSDRAHGAMANGERAHEELLELAAATIGPRLATAA